jgi:hypothetical protein
VTDLAADNGPTIVVKTEAEGCIFTIRKANFDGLHTVVCNGRLLIREGSGGLVLTGPSYSGSSPATTCIFNKDCSTDYASSNDSGSTCSIEEPGAVRTVVKCTGGLKDKKGNHYMNFLIRMHFYLGKSRVKTVVSLKNADDGAEGTFPISYKGYQAFELRLATALHGKNEWTIGNDTETPSSGEFDQPGQSAYIHQGYSQSYYDKPYSQNSPKTIRDSMSDVPRKTVGAASLYAQPGYIIVNQAGALEKSGTEAATPAGWADVQDADSGYGVEIGASYMAANFPKSLEIKKSGQEIRIGISPDQRLWRGACDPAVSVCRKVYYQAWPAYKVTDLFLIFHDRKFDAKTEAEEFFRMQYYLIARAPIDQYNEARVFLYPIVSAEEEDRYFEQLAQHYGRRGWTKLTDTIPRVTRWYSWGAGSAANQVEYRYADLVHRWLARGQTGRYLNTSWFVRFQEQFGWPRADGFRWSMHTPTTDLTPYDGYPSKCSQDNLCNDSRGMRPANQEYAYQDLVGVSDNSSWGHGHWWSLIYYYYMTGDEDANDVLKDGVVTEFTAVVGNGKRKTTSLNNLAWQSSGVNSKLAAARSIATHLANSARYWQYLVDTGGDSQDIAYANEAVENQVTLLLQDPCATSGTGSTGSLAGPTYPDNCVPVYDGDITGRATRGASAYRGFGLGPAEQDDSGRCKATEGNNLVSGKPPELYVRCIKTFMQGLWIDGLWTLAQVEGRGWKHYDAVMDRAYGAALHTDHDLYEEHVAPANRPSSGQLLDRIALDQPNDRTWDSAFDAYGTGPPFEAIYMLLGQYTGDLSPWRSHWENTFVNRAAGQSFNSNRIDEYGTQVTAEVINLILHPPQEKLVGVPLSSDSGKCGVSCRWRLRWSPPDGVLHYYLKQEDDKNIVENVEWDVSSNRPSGDASHNREWFSAKYSSEQPEPNAASMAVTASKTAKFVLKARVRARGTSSGK